MMLSLTTTRPLKQKPRKGSGYVRSDARISKRSGSVLFKSDSVSMRWQAVGGDV